MIRADLTDQVHRAIEVPRRESDDVVCAIFDSIVRALRSGDKVDSEAFTRAKDQVASGAIQEPQPESKC
jgi:nucleoid DNA-binding protein